MTQEWDSKVFLKSDTDHKAVTFQIYGITLAAEAHAKGREAAPAIAVSGPFGAVVKEQSSGLMRRKWRSLAFDLSPRSILHW